VDGFTEQTEVSAPVDPLGSVRVYMVLGLKSSLPIEEHYVGFEVFTAVTMKNAVF
jgi:hypothetical protein